MLKATIIYQQKGAACYNTFGEQFFIDEFYELETPFYVCYVNDNIIAAFQEKKDLVDWMTAPLLNHLNHIKQVDHQKDYNNMV